MKKLIFLVLMACVGFTVQAQEEEKVLEKPKDIKVHEFDEFKNSSFNIYEKSLHYKKMTDGEEGLTAEDLTGAKKLKNDVATLSKKADAMLEKAKNVSPKTKSPAAVKNTKKSVEALNAAQKNLDYIFEKNGRGRISIVVNRVNVLMCSGRKPTFFMPSFSLHLWIVDL